MSENKKYYYMKLKENFFTSERMVVLETMPDGILYSNLLLKMYLMSLKHNGILLLHENLPHTPQTIATFTRHQIGTVERALQIFLKLGFVELLTDARIICRISSCWSGDPPPKRSENAGSGCVYKCRSSCPTQKRTFVHQRIEIKRLENRSARGQISFYKARH